MKLLLLAVVCGLGIPASLSAADARPPVPATAKPAVVQQRVLELVNQARSRGRRCGNETFAPTAALDVSDRLFKAAKDHAQDMANRDYFDHQAPDGSAPRDRVRNAGYRSNLTGENIALGPESAEEVVAGWLASPGHCANLMDARFRDMGLAVVKGRKRGHIYWVQDLARPAR